MRRRWLAGIAALTLTAAGAQAATAGERLASGDGVRATLWWLEAAEYGWTRPWITVERRGERAYDRPIRFRACDEPACVPAAEFAADGASSFAVRDLDRDGEPEVVARVLTSTGLCCDVGVVLRWDGERYRQATHNFLYAGYRLVDLGRDSRWEFSSGDGRFRYVFDSGAGAWYPAQVWRFERGRFRDVTRRHPGVIRNDARRAMRAYRRHGGGGALAGWVADQRMLGNRRFATAFVERERALGRLDSVDGGRDGFIPRLERYLKRWGY